MSRKNTQLRAYVLRDRTDDDHGQEVVFALTAKEARAGGYDDVPYINTVATRAPEFDQYAPGPVTMHHLIENGWHQECGGCWRSVDQYTENAVIDDHEAYCNDVCQARAAGRDAGYAFRRAELKAVEDEAKRRWPDATVSHAGFNIPGYQQPLPAEGFQMYVRLWFPKLDAYATYWDGEKDHEGLDYVRRSA
jgi:hypothetical protein